MLKQKQEKVLASICITCYNQEDTIRESLLSAFNQSYRPLEIVICDDNSTDGTNAVIDEVLSTNIGGGYFSKLY